MTNSCCWVSLTLTQAPTAPSGLVDGIRPFGDQACELKLPCNLEKLCFRSPQLFGEADIVGSFLQQLGEQLPSFDERASAQIASL
jgi:hypothetical protein